MDGVPKIVADVLLLCTVLLCGCTGILNAVTTVPVETTVATPDPTYAVITPDPTGTTPVVTVTMPPTPVPCIPDWVCSDWSDCSTAGTRERSCTDANACNPPEGEPVLTQTCTYTPLLPQPGPYTVNITGNPVCRKTAEDAVNNLKYRASPDYEYFRNYVGAINCSYSTMCYSTGFTTGETPFYTVCIASLENPPTIYIDEPFWTADPVWLAGVLVHEACHSEGYQEYILNEEIEYDLSGFSGWQFERRCCDRMRTTWNQLGAPSYNDDLYRYCSL